MTKKNILITGLPGIGKTTVIKRLAEESRCFHPAGFFTEEIREKGMRKGFRLVSLDGERSILSHVEIKSRYKVGKYGVDLANFDNFLDHISFFRPEIGLFIIDEIGKMECFSDKFIKLLEQLLNSEKPVIATISLKGIGIIDEIKKRSDVQLYMMTFYNRDSLSSEILHKRQRNEYGDSS